jgi:hypothetical protein
MHFSAVDTRDRRWKRVRSSCVSRSSWNIVNEFHRYHSWRIDKQRCITREQIPGHAQVTKGLGDSVNCSCLETFVGRREEKKNERELRKEMMIFLQATTRSLDVQACRNQTRNHIFQRKRSMVSAYFHDKEIENWWLRKPSICRPSSVWKIIVKTTAIVIVGYRAWAVFGVNRKKRNMYSAYVHHRLGSGRGKERKLYNLCSISCLRRWSSCVPFFFSFFPVS